MIQKHGLDLCYKSITTGTYNVETGTLDKFTAASTVRMYPRHLIATVYNYPALVGKENIEFYLANSDLSFYPRTNDEITYRDIVYRIQSIQEHMANSEVALFRLVATRG